MNGKICVLPLSVSSLREAKATDSIWTRDWRKFEQGLAALGVCLRELPQDHQGRFPEDAVREDNAEFQRLVAHGIDRWRIPAVLRRSLDIAFGRTSMSSRMLLSNSRVREHAALSLIGAVGALWNERRWRFFFVTLLDDRGNALEYDAALDFRGLHERLRHALAATGLHGFGIIELQALTNFPQHSAGRTLSFHGHALGWTDDPAFDAAAVAADLSARVTLRSLLGARTVSIVPLTSQRQVTWRGHYILKAPEMGKRVVRSQSTPSGFSNSHVLVRADLAVRLMEALSQLEVSDVLFATRDGVPFQAAWLAELQRWHQQQLGGFPSLDSEGDVAAVWQLLRGRRPGISRSPIDFHAGPSDDLTSWEQAARQWLNTKPATRRYSKRLAR